MGTDQGRGPQGPLRPEEFEIFIQRARALTAAEARLARLIQSIDDELVRAQARRRPPEPAATPEADGAGEAAPAHGQK